jgi:hypothetical protein
MASFGMAHYRALWRFAFEVARGTDRGDAIAATVVEDLRARRIMGQKAQPRRSVR